VPKKLLVYGAAFNEEFADAKGFGWQEVQPPHDWKSEWAACSSSNRG
jgi:glutathione reductase (NADPH)